MSFAAVWVCEVVVRVYVYEELRWVGKRRDEYRRASIALFSCSREYLVRYAWCAMARCGRRQIILVHV